MKTEPTFRLSLPATGCLFFRMAGLLAAGGLLAMAGVARADTATFHPGHYEQRGVGDAGSVATNPVPAELRGVQILYKWKLLQPTSRDKFDFSVIDADLAALRPGQRLVIQIQYKTFSEDGNVSPDWLTGGVYGGGVYQDNKTSWNLVMWHPEVRQALKDLYTELAKRYGHDDRVEAFSLPESLAPRPLRYRQNPDGTDAVRGTPPNTGDEDADFNYAFTHHAPNAARRIAPFSRAAAMGALQENMINLRNAFPASKPVFQYINWGDFRPLMETARANHIGIGGPDTLVKSTNDLNADNGFYHQYPGFSGLCPIGVAVQRPDWDTKRKPQDFGRIINAREVFVFARDNLKANYIFWNLPDNFPPGHNRRKEVVALMNDDRPTTHDPATTGTPGLSGGLATQILQAMPGAPAIPTAPTGLTATTGGGGTVTLHWKPGSGGAAAIGYKIERKVVPLIPNPQRNKPSSPDRIHRTTEPYIEIATAGADATSFTDTGVAANTRYHYLVRASGREGDSPYAYRVIVTAGDGAKPAASSP